MSKTAIIALNGEFISSKNEYLDMLSDINGKFIAADGGALLLEKLGITADVIIGDLDSLTKNDIARFEAKNTEIIKYPVKKNETDGELAINYCIENNFTKIILIFAIGGRIDQELANIFLLDINRNIEAELLIKDTSIEIGFINKKKIFKNKINWGISFLPLDKEAKNVSIKGCKYNIDSYNLYRNKSRGISNSITKNPAKITVEEGSLIYILDKNMQSS
ncbi:MAG: thiamine diphosphokinase [Bacillota bacterium]